ncbi:aldo/keto reductase [Frankia sp. R43]|uniref:aldo/keto reductase n=1 Tax=Frankia sp. R43 TaxID=269536 RepID=UPI0006CA4E9D|nr:aldo/keto reductase [Frankia sp. R43]KPM53617.1 aldo/keto reductase [Frankia sp. R43]
MTAPESLPTVRLGRTDMSVTRVGFGAWAIGGAGWAFGWGAQDDAEAVEAIRAAVRSGVNWIDTAAVYGLGHSEELVARALADIPADERPYVFTKCGLVWDESDFSRPPERVGAPSSIRAEVEASLRRLRTERIDLYQLHWPPQDGTSIADAVGTLHELRAAGKIRAVGVSNLSVGQLEEAATVGGADVLQPPFSMINRLAATDLLPYCAMRDIGVIVYSPMQSGLLSGRWSLERSQSLPEDDWRHRSPEFVRPALDRNLALVDALRPIADRNGTTVAAVAVAWTLSFDGVTAAIVGARRPDQIEAWLPAGGEVVLSGGDLDEIATAIERHGAGEGPARQSPALPGSALV